MSDKMREAFEKWYMTNTFAHIDHISVFYNDLNCYPAPIANHCWKAWQAAQSAAVPVEVMDSRCTYAAFAGRVCNKCGRIHDGGKSVPVVGEVVAYACPFHAGMAVVNGTPCSLIEACNVNEHGISRGFPLIVQPATSITAAELDALRKDAERLQKDAERMQKALLDIAEWTDRYTTPGHPVSTIARAAIAQGEGE